MIKPSSPSRPLFTQGAWRSRRDRTSRDFVSFVRMRTGAIVCRFERGACHFSGGRPRCSFWYGLHPSFSLMRLRRSTAHSSHRSHTGCAAFRTSSTFPRPYFEAARVVVASRFANGLEVRTASSFRKFAVKFSPSPPRPAAAPAAIRNNEIRKRTPGYFGAARVPAFAR